MGTDIFRCRTFRISLLALDSDVGHGGWRVNYARFANAEVPSNVINTLVSNIRTVSDEFSSVQMIAWTYRSNVKFSGTQISVARHRSTRVSPRHGIRYFRDSYSKRRSSRRTNLSPSVAAVNDATRRPRNGNRCRLFRSLHTSGVRAPFPVNFGRRSEITEPSECCLIWREIWREHTIDSNAFPL